MENKFILLHSSSVSTKPTYVEYGLRPCCRGGLSRGSVPSCLLLRIGGLRGGHVVVRAILANIRRRGLNHVGRRRGRCMSMLSCSLMGLLGRRRWHSGMLLLATNHSLIGIHRGRRHHHYVGNLLLGRLLLILRIAGSTGRYRIACRSSIATARRSPSSGSDIVVSILGRCSGTDTGHGVGGT